MGIYNEMKRQSSKGCLLTEKDKCIVIQSVEELLDQIDKMDI